MNYPFKPAKLKDCGGDLTRRWYVEYRIWSERKNKLVRRRFYKGFDKFDTVDSKTKYGKEIVRKYNKYLPTSCIDKVKLTEIDQKNTPKSKKLYPIAIELLLKILIKLYPEDSISYKNYRSTVTNFLDWLELKNIQAIRFDNLDKKTIQSYVDYMAMEQKLTGVTIRNKIAQLKALTNKLIEREEIEFNPFLNLKLPKIVETSKNSAFDPGTIKKIKAWCLENSEFEWLVYMFIYYSYMRPVEIGRLKVKDLDFDNNKIHIPGYIAKNKKTVSIEIPLPLKEELQRYIGTRSNIEHYLFTADECPGTKQISSSYFGKHFLKMRRILNLEEKYTLYSWKHTGVVQAYKNGVDLKAIQLQCRHHSISQTDTYLKSLGFLDNEEFTKGIPTI